MKNFTPKNLILLCALLFPIIASAQFEQKITINGSGAYVYPDLGEELTSYSNGFGIEGGLQFNVNRNISLYGAARFYYLFGSGDATEAYYDNISFGGGAKLNLLPNFKINPFIFAEANLNLIWLEEYNWSDDYYDSDFGTSIGGLGGGGLDFIINDNFAIFIQSGVFYTYWDGRMNAYSQAGVRVNLLKSKTL